MIPYLLIPLLDEEDEPGLLPLAPVVPGLFDEMSIVASIHQWFKDHWTRDAIVILSGETASQSDSLNSVEVDIVTFDPPAVRKNCPNVLDVEIMIHLWVRFDPDQVYLPQDFAHDATALFDQKEIPIQDFQGTGEPRVGGLRMREAQTQDLTEATVEDIGTTFYHLLVTIPGCAQEQPA